MGLKPGMSAALLHVPAGFMARLSVPQSVTLVESTDGADFILDFAGTQAQAEERLTALMPSIGAVTLAWLAYPKGATSAGLDVSRDTLWRFAQTIGLTLVANIAIDEKWSAVRIRPATE